MAKKRSSKNPDRSDPKKNKSLAIRTALKEMPGAKAAEIADSVKSQFGHDVSKNMIYMIKTKLNMAGDGRPKKSSTSKKDASGSPLTTAAMWVDAIKLAKQLLAATGSLANATALLKALGDH